MQWWMGEGEWRLPRHSTRSIGRLQTAHRSDVAGKGKSAQYHVCLPTNPCAHLLSMRAYPLVCAHVFCIWLGCLVMRTYVRAHGPCKRLHGMLCTLYNTYLRVLSRACPDIMSTVTTNTSTRVSLLATTSALALADALAPVLSLCGASSPLCVLVLSVCAGRSRELS